MCSAQEKIAADRSGLNPLLASFDERCTTRKVVESAGRLFGPIGKNCARQASD
jgi:hypothetical protein